MEVSRLTASLDDAGMPVALATLRCHFLNLCPRVSAHYRRRRQA
jgi:hypothetical protein